MHRKLFATVCCLTLSGFSLRGPIQDVQAAFLFNTQNKDPNKSLEPILNSGSTLLVGLIPYLGRETPELQPAKELNLITGGVQPLALKDAEGLIHKASEIVITWRKVPLIKFQKIQRLVAGPFASFESAQRIASRYRDKGDSALVAHPKDWEVWLPKGTQPLKDFDLTYQEKIITSTIKPVLKGQSGEYILSGPIRIEAQDGLKLNGGIYKGPFWLQPDAYGSWTLIEEVPIERYLQGVVPYEIGSSAPSAALSAQAVLARTWALSNSHRFVIDGYHLCSDTQCQVYKNPERASQRVKAAIKNTAGKFLQWKKKPIHAVYHASNGGVMASAPEAWSMVSVPYLRVKFDGSQTWQNRFALPLINNLDVKDLLTQTNGAYGNMHPRFRWVRTLTAADIKFAMNKVGGGELTPTRIQVLKRGRSGRVLALELVNEARKSRKVLELDEIRRTLRDLPSTLFVVKELDKGRWQFSGGGFGHGVGLSQAGAIDLASKGWNALQILKHYYPGTNYGTLRDLPKKP